MRKQWRKIVCSFLIAAMTFSGLPHIGSGKIQANVVNVKQAKVEQMLHSSKESYDLILYFQDTGTSDSDTLKKQESIAQARVRQLLHTAVLSGKADAYEMFEPINAMSVVIHDKALLEELANMDEIVQIQENEVFDVAMPVESARLMSRSYLPDVPDGIEWGIKAVHADKVWEEYGLTGEGVTVGIIDTGVNFRLPSLKHSYKGYSPLHDSYDYAYYRDFTNGKTDPESTGNDHGTHVAGIIVGKEGEGVKQTGVAPGAKFISAKAISADRQYSTKVVIEAFLWLIDQNVDIINCSFGAPYDAGNPYLEKVIALAESRNISVVISSGNVKNNQKEGLLYPAATRAGGIVVGSVNQNLNLSGFSARGPSMMEGMKGVIRPDVVAPGEWVRSTMYSGRLGVLSGTSQAAPHVSGVIALLKEAKPDITVEEIKQVLKLSAQSLTDSEWKSSPNMGYGYGLINAYDAVSYVMGRRIGSIYGNIRSAAPRIMGAYEEIAKAPAFTIKALPYLMREDVEVEDYYEFPPIDAKLINEKTKIRFDFVNRNESGYAYLALSKTGVEEYYPYELETFDFEPNPDGETMIQREYSLSDFVKNDSSEYVYVRLYTRNFEGDDAKKLLLKSFSVYEDSLKQDTEGTSESYSEQKNMESLPISGAANPSNDFSAGPGEVIGTTAPSVENESSVSEGETASLEAPLPSTVDTTLPQTQLVEDDVTPSSDSSLPETMAGLPAGANMATSSDAVAQSCVMPTTESVLPTVSNQSHLEDEVIKSQSTGEKDHYSIVNTSDTSKAIRDMEPSITVGEDSQVPQITHQDIVENNGIYNDGATLQSMKYTPISLQNLNQTIPFKPMVKVLNSGKSTYVNDKGYYHLTHTVNKSGKPLKLEISAYGYETKVIDVDLNIQKDQQQDIILNPAPLATVQGRLLDDNGEPIGGAIVHILEDRLIENVRTAKDGSYRIHAAYRGAYTIMFSKEGYLTKTMRVGLRAGENQLKDVRLYKLSNPADVSITYGFDRSLNRPSNMEVLVHNDNLEGGAVRFSPPQKDSILKSASLYLFNADGYRGDEITIGVLGEKDGRLIERIPFQNYKVHARGWVTFDLSSYYLYSKEPVYVVYLHNKPAYQSIGVGVKKDAFLDAVANSYLFDGDLTPFTNISNYRGHGIAMTTNWLTGVLPAEAEDVEDNHNFDPNEFGPTYEHQINDKIIEIGENSGNTKRPPISEREIDDGGLGSNTAPTAGTKPNLEKPNAIGSLSKEDLEEIDSHGYQEQNTSNDSNYATNNDGSKVKEETLIANGFKLLHNQVVPKDTVEGIWYQDPGSHKWKLFVGGKLVESGWVRVFRHQPTLQGVHYSWYHFRDGEMETGFTRSSDGYFYYLHESKDSHEGELALGWQLVKGEYFYFRKNPSQIEGAMLTGWYISTDNKRFYLYPDGENLGKLASGWVTIQGKRYYFSEEQNTIGELRFVENTNPPTTTASSQTMGLYTNETSLESSTARTMENSNLNRTVDFTTENGTGMSATTTVSSSKGFMPDDIDLSVGNDKKQDNAVQIGVEPGGTKHIISDVKPTSTAGMEVGVPSSEPRLDANAWKPTPKDGLIFVEDAFPYANSELSGVFLGERREFLEERNTVIAEVITADKVRGDIFKTLQATQSSAQFHSDYARNEEPGRVSSQSEGRGAYRDSAADESSHDSTASTVDVSSIVSNVNKDINASKSGFWPMIELD